MLDIGRSCTLENSVPIGSLEDKILEFPVLRALLLLACRDCGKPPVYGPEVVRRNALSTQDTPVKNLRNNASTKGEKSSQEPPQINHNCCYECGDSLDGIFCRHCICKSCGKGAHFGYNCPPKDPIISKPEPCNQTINEIPQTFPSLEPSLPHVSKPNFVDNSPYFSYPPPQPQFKTYSYEYCGNDSHYGYDYPSQVPFVYEPEPCYDQNFSDNYYPQNSPSFCCAYCGGSHFDYQCQLINETYYELNSSYDSSGFDQPQLPQDSVDHQGILQVLNKMEEKLEEIIRDRRKKIEDMSIEEMMHEQQLVDREIKEIINDLGYKRFRGEEIDEEYKRDSYEEEKYSAACRYMLSITCDDEDDSIPLGDIIARNSTSKAITPDLPIEEPDNSLNMGDEHLDTIPATESDEVIKSSVENLVPIPSEFEGISDDTCDVPNCDDNRVNVESELVESLINHNPTPDLVFESPSPFPIPVADSDSFLEESDTSLSHLDNSLPEFETFSDHTEETRSGNTTTHVNYSLPEYDSFLFEIEPDQ
ncbi:hypothetical protein Tco_0673824 [Tanacetum coccineum]